MQCANLKDSEPEVAREEPMDVARGALRAHRGSRWHVAEAGQEEPRAGELRCEWRSISWTCKSCVRVV